MGDFEDVFGAGADADSIVDGYSKAYNRASHVEKANWFGRASAEKIEIAIAKDEFDAGGTSTLKLCFCYASWGGTFLVTHVQRLQNASIPLRPRNSRFPLISNRLPSRQTHLFCSIIDTCQMKMISA